MSDPQCEGIALASGTATLPAGASTTYTCEHVLTAVGEYTNTATDTATPPPGEGSPLTHTSNTVVAEVGAKA